MRGGVGTTHRTRSGYRKEKRPVGLESRRPCLLASSLAGLDIFPVVGVEGACAPRCGRVLPDRLYPRGRCRAGFTKNMKSSEMYQQVEPRNLAINWDMKQTTLCIFLVWMRSPMYTLGRVAEIHLLGCYSIFCCKHSRGHLMN